MIYSEDAYKQSGFLFIMKKKYFILIPILNKRWWCSSINGLIKSQYHYNTFFKIKSVSIIECVFRQFVAAKRWKTSCSASKSIFECIRDTWCRKASFNWAKDECESLVTSSMKRPHESQDFQSPHATWRLSF